jgi:glucose/arabinose dehydrogenase
MRPTFRSTGFLHVFLLASIATLGACDDPGEPEPDPLTCTSPVTQGLCLASITTALDYPAQLEQPPGDERIFVTNVRGTIHIIRDDTLVGTPFLDLRPDVQFAPERGLLGMAFAPDFTASGHLYVAFTDLEGNTRVHRFTAEPGEDRVDPETRKEILVVERESGRHSGGQLRFGPDGMLWIAIGDATMEWEAQDSSSLYGSLLRIDVVGGDPYAIPPDNPFVGVPGAREEIWATGLRHPWRFSFESDGRLFIADVGASEWEELNIVSYDEGGGYDFGWPHMEGPDCLGTPDCHGGDFVVPVFQYDHGTGCSILGGTIYRRDDLPVLRDRYIVADYCGWMGSLAVDGTEADDLQILSLGETPEITSLGTDAEGRLYLLRFDDVSRVIPAPVPD